MTSGSQETTSLVKRLAGPSSGKAGLAKDQSEINRIIAEVSKGSKFYENEKKKDKELTERINRILKQREEVLKGVDIGKVEMVVDHMLEQLEFERDLSQIIVHVDMDAFYASVELLRDPSLAGKPFGVGGGVLSTASYEARKYGVRSGMAGFVAKKLCPDLILLKNDFSKYSEMSNKIFDIFRRYDPNLQAAGCDEGYLNITEYCKVHGVTSEECVQNMRQAVFEETKLTVSAGIAPNKMLAKICSDKNKPNGQFQLPFDRRSVLEFMRELSIRKIPGIGRVNERLLESIGVKTCGDIFTHRATLSLMDKQFGLRFLLRTHLGIASNIVAPHQREERKSIGAERTFSPLGDREAILRKLQEVAAELEQDMEDTGWTGRTITLKYKLDTYQVFTRAKSLSRWVSKKEDIFAIGKELLLPELPLRLRLIGLRVTKLKDLQAISSSSGIKRFFEPIKNDHAAKRRKLDHGETDEFINISDEEDEDVMPGFHEHDEMGENDDTAEDNGDSNNPFAHLDDDTTPPGAERPNLQKPVSYSGKSTFAVRDGVGPQGWKVEQRISEQPTIPLESHTCPICGKTLQTDNQGFNAHVDFCLSKGAIKEAQAESITPKKKDSTSKDASGWSWNKPPTSSKAVSRSHSSAKKPPKSKDGRKK